MEDLLGRQVSIKELDINEAIKAYMALIVKTISETTGRYVSVENDDEFSIGLLAFKEALDKFDEGRGNFSAFAKLVISSRVKNYLIKKSKDNLNISLEQLSEEGIEIPEIIDNTDSDKNELAIEIEKLKRNIEEFGFSFEDLIDESPKHEDTRNRAIKLSEDISIQGDLTKHMYEKKRLPIKQISLRFTVTEKIIKRSKKFIISVVIIFNKNYRNLKLWIKR